MTRRSISAAVLLALAGSLTLAQADDRTEYNRRAAARDVALFQALDRNGDGAVTREEAKGDLDLGPRFDDVDLNRDGVMTRDELQRYIAQRYGVETQAAAR